MSEALQMQLRQLLAACNTALPNSDTAQSPGDLFLDLEQLAQVTKTALQSGLTEELQDTLEEQEQRHETEISALCESDLTNSALMTQQLDAIDDRARQIKLKASLVKRNMDLSSKQLVEKALAHEQMRRTRQNIAATITSVTQCLQGLGHINQIHELLKSNRRVAAVQNLEDLQNLNLADLQTVGLGSLVSKTVPMLSQEITKATLTSLDSFFDQELLSEQADLVGERAFNLIRMQREAWGRLANEFPHLMAFRFNSPVELAYRRSNENYLTIKSLKIDLSPLLEADMVFHKLGKSHELKSFIDLQLSQFSDSLVTSNLDDMIIKLQRTVGLCLIDRVLSRYLPQIRPAKGVDDQWERISQNLNRHIANIITQMQDTKLLKSRLGLVMDTLCNFAFNVSSISDLFSSIMTRVCKNAISDMAKECATQWETSDQMQLVITTEASYQSVMGVVFYDGPSLEELNLPYAMPFSELYVVLCKCLRTLLRNGESFLDHFQENQAYVVSEIANHIDVAFNHLIKTYCDPVIAGNNRELIVQTLVNLQMFHFAAERCERILAKMRNGRKGSVVINAKPILEREVKEAETRIYVLLEETVLAFFNGSSFSWTTEEEQLSPSPMVLEMTTYLLTMANTILLRLPPEVRSLAFFNLAENVNTGLKNILQEITPSATQQALTNFDVDLQFLEKSLAEIATGADTSMPLLESRQLLDFLRSEDPLGEYNNPSTRLKKYDRLDIKSANALLLRIRPELMPKIGEGAQIGRQGTLMHKPSIMRYLGGDK